jgi:DNA-binding response OmpR family regulator
MGLRYAAPAMTTERLPRVLVVDDELTMREFLEMRLGYEGFEVRTAPDGPGALETARAWSPDLVILDLMLPGLDGLEICRRLRAGGDVGILMLSARGNVDDRIEGLDAGADDYIVKPFDMDELNARLRAVLRRPGKRMSTILEAGNLKFDVAQRRATVDSQPVELPRQEAALLELLLRSQGAVVKREEIQRSLYGFDDEVTPNAVDAAVSRLRKRLRTAGAAVEIAVLRGVGCMLESKPT